MLKKKTKIQPKFGTNVQVFCRYVKVKSEELDPPFQLDPYNRLMDDDGGIDG